MFFGGMNGATSFYPDQIRESSYMAPLYITDFKIFNKSVSLGSDQSILKIPIEQTKYIPLSYKHSSFTFTFALLNYGTSERNLYAYKMDGFETDWNYAGTRRFATYTNLNPGSYTFRVKEISNDGLWNEKGASIKISISPPFWKTWWFKFIVVAIVVLACWHFCQPSRTETGPAKSDLTGKPDAVKIVTKSDESSFPAKCPQRHPRTGSG